MSGNSNTDLSCGTGLNFPYLFQAVGPEGRIIAVDIAPKMLQKAKERANENGWNNVEFIQGDVSWIELPDADSAAAFWYINDFPGAVLNPVFNQICRFTNANRNHGYIWSN